MSEFKDIKITQLVASSSNQRSEFEENSLNELAESVKAHGVLQPIIVRINPDNNKQYEVVCGERRFRATKIAGIKTIPASIRELTDDEVFEIQIIENLERKDVHPMDEAIAFQRMLDSGKYSMEDIAAKVAKNVTFVAHRLKLNDLIPELKEDFLRGEFGIGVAILFATVDETIQKGTKDGFLNSYNPGYPTVKDLRTRLKYKGEDLDNADFDTEDPLLFPEAGVCSLCPKCSKSNESLFPELEENICFDKICFKMKDSNHYQNITQKIIDDNPGVILICDDFEDISSEFFTHFADQGKPLFDNYNYSSKEKDGIHAYHVTDLDFNYVEISDSTNEEDDNSNIPTSDPNQNIKSEISNIIVRASRALELDREKIYKRAIEELVKNTEKNEALINSDPLLQVEKSALITRLISYQDQSWFQEKYDKGFEWYAEKYDAIESVYSEELYNEVIRRHLQRELISDSLLDFGKQYEPKSYKAIMQHYFPSEIELFTLEQDAVAAKRITKSNARIEVLQNEIDGKIDSVKRCSSCKKSDADFAEEFDYPMMWKDDLCLPCSLKFNTELKEEPKQQCRVCGCTENDCKQCIEKTGFACHWIADDLCSACQEVEDAIFEETAQPSIELPSFEKITRKKKFSLNNSYFKNCNSQTEPSTPFEVMAYFKQHDELPFDLDSEENPNWLYDTYIEFQKRHGVYNSQFFTPPATAERIAELADEYFSSVGLEPYLLDACCGFGMLTKPLIDKGFIVQGFDNNSEILKMYNEFTGCISEENLFSDLKVTKKWKSVVSNPPYEIKVLKDFLLKLSEDILANNGIAILLLPKGFIDKDKPAPLVWALERFTVLHREDMQEDFARTGVKAEIVILKKN